MCQIIAISLPDSKSQTHRRAVLAGDVLTLTHGHNRKDIASYKVRELTHVAFPARAFVLDKIAGGTDAEAENYAVLIDPSAHHSCECKGFYRHGRCKHVDALVELLAEGALDPAPERTDIPADFDPPVESFPTADQIAADTITDDEACEVASDVACDLIDVVKRLQALNAAHRLGCRQELADVLGKLRDNLDTIERLYDPPGRPAA